MDRLRRFPLFPWAVRLAWAVLPFVSGPAFADALDGRSTPVRTAASVLLWAAWGVTLCASLVLHPVSLTLLRLVAPTALAAAAWAALQDDVGAGGLLAVAATALATLLVFLPETGVVYVNGPAYPNVTAGAPVAAVLLLAAGRPVPGIAAALVAAAAGWFLGRALHGLSRRWVVFVPAGFVVHDPMTLVDPVLFPKLQIAAIEPAEAGTDALDLTQGSPGLAVELRLRETAGLVLTKPGERVGPTVDADRILVTPTRPGRVLAEARERMRGAPPVEDP
jgi:hypothetical protein